MEPRRACPPHWRSCRVSRSPAARRDAAHRLRVRSRLYFRRSRPSRSAGRRDRRRPPRERPCAGTLARQRARDRKCRVSGSQRLSAALRRRLIRRGIRVCGSPTLGRPDRGAQGNSPGAEAGRRDRHHRRILADHLSLPDEPAPGGVGQAPGAPARTQHGPIIGAAPAACPPPRGGLCTDTSVGPDDHGSRTACRLARGDAPSSTGSPDPAAWVLGELAVAQGWATREELEQMAEALIAWGEAPDAFYARPSFTAIGWA